MSHFTVLTATEFPQDLPTFFKEEMPDSCVARFVARRLWLDRFSSNSATQTSEPQLPQITDQDRIELLAEFLAEDRLQGT